MMSEQDPVLRLNMGEESFEVRRENSTLYTFLGRAGVSLTHFNHIFMVTDEEQSQGMYMFSDHPVFPDVANHMLENAYPMHLNLPEVAQCDQDAYDRHITTLAGDLDTIPDDWS